MTKTLKELYCNEYHVPEEHFAESVFRECLPLIIRLPALLLRKSSPTVFSVDFAFIAEIATVSSRAVFKMEINRFHGVNARDQTFLRGLFKVRMSGKRLIRLQRLLKQ